VFYRKFCLLIVIGLLLLFPAMAHGNAKQWRLVHGYVLHVQPEENKIMLEVDGRPHIYLIELDCTILRQGSPTSLASLRPITEYDLQDALCPSPNTIYRMPSAGSIPRTRSAVFWQTTLFAKKGDAWLNAISLVMSNNFKGKTLSLANINSR